MNTLVNQLETVALLREEAAKRKNGKPSYNVKEVLESLQKKKDLKINGTKRHIQVLTSVSARRDIGIKSRGMLDYLGKYQGFRIQGVSKFY